MDRAGKAKDGRSSAVGPAGTLQNTSVAPGASQSRAAFVGNWGSSGLRTQLLSVLPAQSELASSAAVQRQEADTEQSDEPDTLFAEAARVLQERLDASANLIIELQVRRATLLLENTLIVPTWEAEDLVDYLMETAADEEAVRQQVPQAAELSPELFPTSWSQTVFDAMDLGLNLDLDGDAAHLTAERTHILEALPAYLAEHGSLDFGNGDLVLTAQLADLQMGNPIGDLASVQCRIAAHVVLSHFVTSWEAYRATLRDDVATGQRMVELTELDLFVVNHPEMSHLPFLLADSFDAEGFERLQGDLGALTADSLVELTASLVEAVLLADVSWLEANQQLADAFAQADGLIAGLSDGQRLERGLSWAIDSGYLGGVARQLVEAIWQHAPEIAASLVAFSLLQLVPGVNIALDLILIAVGAVDALNGLNELLFALGRMQQAQTVAELQQRSREASDVIVARGPGLLMSILGMGGTMRLLRGRADEALDGIEAIVEGAEASALRHLYQGANVNVTTRRVALSEPHDHHVFPQEFMRTDPDFYRRRGIEDIDEFCVRVSEGEHQALHGGGNWEMGKKWQAEWNNRFIEQLRILERRVQRDANREEMLILADEMMQWGLIDHLPLVRYGSEP